MDIAYYQEFDQRQDAAVLIVPFWEGEKKHPIWMFRLPELEESTEGPIDQGDFKGKQGELTLLYMRDFLEKRCLFLGLGKEEKCSLEVLRQCVAKAIRLCLEKNFVSCNILLPTVPPLSADSVCKAVAESAALTCYDFSMKSKKDDDKQNTLSTITLIGPSKHGSAICEQSEEVVQAVNFTRDLVNGNADDVTPQYLAKKAMELSSKNNGVETKVLGKEELEKQGLGLLLAVGRGSVVDPVLIIVSYKGDPSSSDHTVIVGKGVTYDTGGLNLKPTGSMETMKCDMAGGAAVLGTIKAISALKLKVNVTALVPATENAIDAASYKPGDVYKSYLGKTVEITNTDAEGRLILADALTFAEKHLAPTRMIDLATLTGAIEVALGNERSGLFSNNEQLAHMLEKAGNATGEKLWAFPLDPEYRDYLKSDIADIKNSGKRKAGSITAAIFLQEFVGKTPWAHLDIAGTAYLDAPRTYNRTLATGMGVRLLVEFFEELAKQEK